jgi:hypothetical protein
MDMVDDSSVQWPFCTRKFNSKFADGYSGPEYSFGDCGNAASFVYIALYKLMTQYLLLNLCIG